MNKHLLNLPNNKIFISIKFVWLFYCPKISVYFWIILFLHESVRKSISYVFTLSALVPRVYVLAYDNDIHSVLVHFYTSSTSVLFLNFLFQYTTLHRVLYIATVSKNFKINLEGQTYVHFYLILSRNVKIFGIMASL